MSQQLLAQRPLGVDVSSYQGAGVNWSSVKASGRTFAWAKATEGTTVNDPDFTINQNNGKAAGMYMGAYHFAHPNTATPGAESGHFWAMAGAYTQADGKTFMPMLDMEVFNGVVGASSYSDWANQWNNTVVANAAGQAVTIRPFIYVSACSACNFNSSVSGWFSDIANYNGQNPQTGTPWSSCAGCAVWGAGVWTAWQYSSTVSVPGIAGGVDADVYNGSAAQLASTLIATSKSGVVGVYQVQLVGDFDGDGKNDLAWRKTGWTEWIIDYGNGAVNGHAFTDGRTDFDPHGGAQVTLVGDFDHDGKSDIAWRKTGWGEWIIAYGNGTVNQHAFTDGRTDFNPIGGNQITLVGDFDGDAKSDLAWRKTGWGEWIIGFGNGVINTHALTDGRTDFAGDTTSQMNFAADYDGDGKTDIAWRKTGWTEWIIDYGNGVVNGHALTDGRTDFNPASNAQVAFAGDFNNFNADKKCEIPWRKTGWGNWIVVYSSGTGSSLTDGRTDFDPALH
jgi:GH25 family lysozyme M1 (1,4-beta-N-acetylmuramidase)